MTTFHLTVVTPDGCAFEGQAERIVCRAIDGDLAILAKHGDYCTALGMGEAHIVDADGQRRRAACMGGLLSVLDGDVRLVATTWEWAEDIDQARAEASKKRAEEILAEFNSGDKTEDSFAELANKYSEDEGSNTNGGLYANIAKGQMVQEFNDFCFAGHKAGDTGIVYGESSSYAGYHVMYFVGEGEQYSDYLAKNSLLTSDMNAWLEELTSAYETSVGGGIRFVGK